MLSLGPALVALSLPSRTAHIKMQEAFSPLALLGDAYDATCGPFCYTTATSGVSTSGAPKASYGDVRSALPGACALCHCRGCTGFCEPKRNAPLLLQPATEEKDRPAVSSRSGALFERVRHALETGEVPLTRCPDEPTTVLELRTALSQELSTMIGVDGIGF